MPPKKLTKKLTQDHPDESSQLAHEAHARGIQAGQKLTVKLTASSRAKLTLDPPSIEGGEPVTGTSEIDRELSQRLVEKLSAAAARTARTQALRAELAAARAAGKAARHRERLRRSQTPPHTAAHPHTDL